MNSIEKTIFVLKCFTKEPYEFSIAEITNLTGFNRSTTYRYIMSLLDSGLLMETGNGKKIALGPETFKMGNIYLTNGDDKDNTMKILEEIAKETKESVGLARREGDRVLSIYAVESHQQIKMNDRPGTYYPMNKGTYGKCLMAFNEVPVTLAKLNKHKFEKTCPNTLTDPQKILEEYEQIRSQGFVLSIEETFPHVIGVGVPLTSNDGKIRNVVAVSFFKNTDYLEKIESIKNTLFKYKSQLEKYLR